MKKSSAVRAAETGTGGGGAPPSRRLAGRAAIRVFAADAHPIVLSGIELVLQGEPGIELVGKCSDSGALVASAISAKPDVILLDLRMPRNDGLTIVHELREAGVVAPVVLVTGDITEEEVFTALRLGVRGVLLKQMPARFFADCIRRVHAGGRWIENASLARVVDRMLRREAASQEIGPRLTPREMEVLRLVVGNLSNEEIAERLVISHGTVKVHLHAVYRKLEISGRAELVRFAKDKALI